jgi:hypothetical protein
MQQNQWGPLENPIARLENPIRQRALSLPLTSAAPVAGTVWSLVKTL